MCYVNIKCVQLVINVTPAIPDKYVTFFCVTFLREKNKTIEEQNEQLFYALVLYINILHY